MDFEEARSSRAKSRGANDESVPTPLDYARDERNSAHGGCVTDKVVSRIEGRTGRLSLNRPQAINALDLDMVRAITAALQSWQQDPAVKLILIDHAEGRGFCAGGDVVTI